MRPKSSIVSDLIARRVAFSLEKVLRHEICEAFFSSGFRKFSFTWFFGRLTRSSPFVEVDPDARHSIPIGEQ